MAVSDHIYKDNPFVFRIFIGTVDITDLVQTISGLDVKVDVSVPGSFQRPRLSLTLQDDDTWNPNISTNGFTAQSFNANGYLAPVTVRVGYYDNGTFDTQVQFQGKIDTVNQDIKSEIITITAADESLEVRKDNIDNFGITKHLKLRPGDFNSHGSYPYPKAFTPASDGSFVASGLTVVENLILEGEISPTNVKPGEYQLETESDELSSDPAVSFKAPYRWRSISKAIEDILNVYGITNPNVQIDDVLFPRKKPTTFGRPGYYVEHANSAEANDYFQWEGYVTDFVVDGNDIYLLYSARGNKPRLFKYEIDNDFWSVVVQSASDAEWWRLAKSGTDIFILGTSVINNPAEPVLGAYRSSETGSGVKIYKWNGSDLSTFVSGSVTLKPNLAFYYHFGFAANGNVRTGLRPDSRRGFDIYNNELYYLFANAGSFGIAKTSLSSASPSAVVTISSVGDFADCSLDFTISGSTLYGGCCFQRNHQSNLRIFKKSL